MKLDKAKLPKHVGIIMDGNRRWAKKRGQSLLKGHSYVVDEVIEKLIDRCGELGIEYLTLWAFSTENWERDKAEVEGILKLFRKAIINQAEKLIKKGARMKIVGDMSKFPEDIRRGMEELVERSKNNTKITVVFALNYGGRDEILRAVRKLVSSELVVTEEMLERCLDTVGMPDPDLIIRPGGEMRLSGFLTWQAVYAELYFTDVLMPEFNVEELDKALAEYERRQRRFGR